MTSLRIVIAGAGGLLGRALISRLEADKHQVTRLVRKASSRFGEQEVTWDPASGKIDPEILDGAHAVICLNGANLADHRWTADYKRILMDSRLQPTELLAKSMKRLVIKPKVYLVASGISVFGDRGDEWLTEESPSGSGFLTRLVHAWEGAALPAAEAGVRTVNLRLGPVLSSDGGALGKMLLPFKLGLGGRLGDGKQYMPWIAMHDCIEAMVFCMTETSLNGPVNVVSPNPVTNAAFTQAMGKVLKRPTVLPAPAFALRMALGEMADEALLASCRAKPAKLLDAGFTFRHPHVEDALKQQLHH